MGHVRGGRPWRRLWPNGFPASKIRSITTNGRSGESSARGFQERARLGAQQIPRQHGRLHPRPVAAVQVEAFGWVAAVLRIIETLALVDAAKRQSICPIGDSSTANRRKFRMHGIIVSGHKRSPPSGGNTAHSNLFHYFDGELASIGPIGLLMASSQRGT